MKTTTPTSAGTKKPIKTDNEDNDDNQGIGHVGRVVNSGEKIQNLSKTKLFENRLSPKNLVLQRPKS